MQVSAVIFITLFTIALSPSAATTILPKVRVCTMDKGFGGKTRPDGSGTWQVKYKEKFDAIPLDIEYYAAPRARCIQDIKNHKAEAIYAAYSEERKEFLSFPGEHRSSLRTHQAVDSIDFYLFKHKTAHIDWNGKEFIHADNHKLLLQQGIQIEEIQNLTKEFQLIEVKSVFQILSMLEKKRASAAIIAMDQIKDTLKEKADISHSTHPVYTTYVFLAFDKKFYHGHSDLVEKIWKAMED